MSTKRQESLTIAEELLSDIELTRIDPVAIVRKASRLARLMDDKEAMTWLSYEVGGYIGTGGGMTPAEWIAAGRSGRRYFKKEKERTKEYAHTSSLSSQSAIVETAKIRLKSSESSSVYERAAIQSGAVTAQGIIDAVIGSVYSYVSQMYQELRFGSAVESAFENVRNRVDGAINQIVPDALPVLTTALENAQTEDPEQWKNAAKACRDLVKATADALRPPGPNVNNIKMGETNYINRLVDWISKEAKSNTKADMINSDLEHLGRRLDASTDGGNKGAHAKVSKQDASRFIIGTYILLGDILNLKSPS